MAMLLAILILMVAPLFYNSHSQSLGWYVGGRYVFWGFVVVFVLLMWVGGSPAEEPYVRIGRVLTGLYFLLFFSIPCVIWAEDVLVRKFVFKEK